MSNNTTLLILPQQVVQNSVLHTNVDEEKLSIYIRTVQDVWLQPVIGTNLLQHLQRQTKEGSLTDNEKKLVCDYIHPVLVWYATAEFYMFNSFKAKAQGVVQERTDNADPASIADIKSVINDARVRGKHYADLLLQFLEKNKSEYRQFGSNVDEAEVKAAEIKSGQSMDTDFPIFLGGTIRRGRRNY